MSPNRKKKRKKKISINMRYFILFLALLFLASAYFSFQAFSKDAFQLETSIMQTDDSRRNSASKRMSLSDEDEGAECISSKKELREGTCTDNSGDTTQSLTGMTGSIREDESLLDIVKKEIPDVSYVTETKHPLPKIAVVVDDLGPNKRPVQSLLDSAVPLVFSILPHETHSKWIADTAYERGHEIIAHIPMEAETEKKLGAGGLYTWMKADEIQEVLEKDVETIPHIIGISNHMGSAFTADEKAMDVLMAALKEKKFVFLDSMTTQTSAGTIAARKHGVHLYKRNIFLDNKDDPAYIEKQWKKAVKLAKQRGYAIVLAHPRKNTITFLEKVLRKNDVEFVTLSELLVVQ
jgi:polysaccharide deacetylase 2 family uncharacterized protein YibQ